MVLYFALEKASLRRIKAAVNSLCSRLRDYFTTLNLTIFKTDFIGKVFQAGTGNHYAAAGIYLLFLSKGSVSLGNKSPS